MLTIYYLLNRFNSLSNKRPNETQSLYIVDDTNDMPEMEGYNTYIYI